MKAAYVARAARGRRIGLMLAAVLVPFVLAGCLQIETTVRVRPDGSGEVVERFLMAHGIVEMLAGMAQMGGEPDFSLINPQDLQSRAAQMGQGVSFSGVEPLSDSWGEGYVARYQFRDINSLRVNQNPGDSVPLESDEPSVREFLTFSMQRGNPATLEVRLPQPDEVQTEAEAPPSEEELEAAAQFYRDMRVAVRIEVVGTLIDTNAQHSSGNTVTLLDLDFNRILDNPTLRRSVLSSQASSLSEVQQIAREAEGFDIEPRERVMLRLR